MTAGDVDADWEEAYAVGDEAPGGDNPTPDQDRVDDAPDDRADAAGDQPDDELRDAQSGVAEIDAANADEAD